MRLSDRCGLIFAISCCGSRGGRNHDIHWDAAIAPCGDSTPIKILLFVMVDGWNLLIGSLMRSFD